MQSKDAIFPMWCFCIIFWNWKYGNCIVFT